MEFKYEAPVIEIELTTEDVEREVYYAGGLTMIPPPQPE